ncbi:WXG100 family type VII secretion target [Mycolicibacterium llatzerense]|uniref:WXG100 family type VII secretion target n=1 Tax=Mycolicibacterium llatzerense TaxID=280871 RepID=UPI0008DE016D|nr:WXG100 family type VII secretion target [Mycolicibacterium llatzerense]
MKQLTVDAEVALQAAQGVGSDAAELREELSRLEREWQDIAHGWKGSAASAYTALWEQWHDGATKVVQTALESSEKLNRAAVLYTQQDEESAHLVQAASPGITTEMGL